MRPFFRDHFARLDRQIVLVDALRGVQRRARGAARSRSARWPGSSTASASAAARSSARCSGRASTRSCSPRPRPIICITPATTGWRRSCKRMVERADARANFPARRSMWWRSPPCAPHARRTVQQGREKLPSILGTPATGEIVRRRSLRRRDRSRDVSRRPAGQPRRRCSAATARSAACRNTACRPDRLPLPALPPALARTRGRRRARAAPHPPRPRASVPDRRQAAMSDKPHHRKPAAFRLDDPRVILMDAEDDPSRPARGKVHDHAGSRPRPASGHRRAGCPGPQRLRLGRRCSGRRSAVWSCSARPRHRPI